MKEKAIVIVINKLGIGGAERVVLDEVNELYHRGAAVILITLRPETEGKSFMPLCLLPPENRHLVHFRSLLDLRAWFLLVRLLRSKDPRAVISHLWFANTIARIAAWFARVETVLTFEHNVYDNLKTKKQFFVDWLLQSLSSQVIAVSKVVHDSLIEHHIDPHRIVVIYNGVQTERYSAATPSSIKSELRLTNTFVFLCVGRLVYQKAFDVLLRAFAKLDRGVLLIAGEGEERSMLESLVKELKIENRVYFLGARTDVPELLKMADCFVFPSRWEGHPIVLIEAMAAGVPIVVADFPAALSIIVDKEDALVVPRENPMELAEAMCRVMDDAGLRRALADKAVQNVSRFSIERHVDTLLSYV